MTVAEYARLHGLTWKAAKGRLAGALPLDERRRVGYPLGSHALPAEKVAAIRAMLAAGEKHLVIALVVGCSTSTVSLIRNGKRRKVR